MNGNDPSKLFRHQTNNQWSSVSPQSKPSPFKLCDVPAFNCDDQTRWLQLACLRNTPPASRLTTLNINRNHNRSSDCTCGGGGVRWRHTLLKGLKLEWEFLSANISRYYLLRMIDILNVSIYKPKHCIVLYLYYHAHAQVIHVIFRTFRQLLLLAPCWQVLVGQISVWQQAADGLWRRDGQFQFYWWAVSCW